MNNEIKIQPSKGNNKVEISNNFAQYFEQLAKKHADDAKESELLAKDWANKLGSTVDDIEYSAKHYALKSKEEHDGAVTDIATAKTELEQSIATGLEDYNTNAQAKSDSLQKQFDTSISDIKKQETTSVNAVKTTQTTAESSITELKTSAESSITNGMADITSNKEQSMSAINENRETSLAEIESAKSGAVSSVNTTKDNAVSTVKQTGADEYNKILSTGIDSKLGENLITNCLKEVPQRIKYTLENGTLTIKAGSVVIVPYGTEDKTADLPKGATFINENFKVYDTQYTEDSDGKGKFFVWAELVNDISDTEATTDSVLRLCEINITNASIEHKFKTESGTSEASFTGIYYQTTDNRIANYTAGVITNEYLSLPVVQVLSNASYISGSVTHVFNGMGVMGSTIWADKGVKGLVPNGRNADGTLVNEEVTIDKLVIASFPDNISLSAIVSYELADGNQIPNAHIAANDAKFYFETMSQPTGSSFKWFDKTRNIQYFHDDNQPAFTGLYRVKNLNLAEVIVSSGKIQSLQPKLPFRAADENDIDGKWVRQSLHIIKGETVFPLGSLQYRDYDISNYLPNDGHIYELAVEILAFSGSSTNATSHWWVSDTVIGGQTCSCGGRAYSNARDQQYANGIILMSSRTLRLYCSSTGTAPTISVLRVYAYRKVR
nr:MAG TPA: hypothetical protein [Caudoviricetes sp.]